MIPIVNRAVFSAIVISGLMLSSTKVVASSSIADHPSNQQVIAAAFNRWAAGGSGFFDEVLADTVRWTIQGSGPAAKTYHSKAEFLRDAVAPFAAQMQTPLKPEVKGMWASDDEVVVYWTGQAKTLSGKPYHNAYVWIFRMHQQQAVEVIAFLDLAAYYEVLHN